MKFPLLILLILAAAAFAQDKPKPAPPKPPAPEPTVTTKTDATAPAVADAPAKMVADFFSLLEKGEIESAYAGLTKGSKIIEKPDDLRVLKQKTKEAIEAFGTIAGNELVETKPVGTRLLRRTYLSLGSEFPLRWRFYFYIASGRWRLIDMRVDDRLTGLFDETPEARVDDTHLPSGGAK